MTYTSTNEAGSAANSEGAASVGKQSSGHEHGRGENSDGHFRLTLSASTHKPEGKALPILSEPPEKGARKPRCFPLCLKLGSLT